MIDINILKKFLEKVRFGENIIIPKRIMKNIPKECEETILGDPTGAFRQFRCDPNIHILEYEDKFLIHKDRFDPRREPFLHLIFDSPETLLALVMANILGISGGKLVYNIIKNKMQNPRFHAVIAATLIGIVSGFFTYYIVKELKHL